MIKTKSKVNTSKVLAGKALSYWIDSTPTTDYPELNKDIKVDVAVIGGGLAGLNTALYLNREGAVVAVIEAKRIGMGASGHTTAKVSSAHSLIYNDLLSNLGREKAQLYSNANQNAIHEIQKNIEKMEVECDFQKLNSYIYAVNDEELKRVEAELEATKKLNLPTFYVETISTGFPIKGAIGFKEQGYFHPRKYMLALANEITQHRSFIFENTRAFSIDEGHPCKIRTAHGTVTADKVVQATNYPFHDPFFLFTRLVAKRSYIYAVNLKAPGPLGLFFEPKERYRSFRPHTSGEEELYLVGGEKHETGHITNTLERYTNLEKFINDNFNQDRVRNHWSSQDCYPVDRVPMIGKLHPGTDNVFVATGFNGWGMTHSTIAGQLLTDMINGKKNELSNLYSPIRFGPIEKAGAFVKNNYETAKKFFGGFFEDYPKENPEMLEKYQAKKVEYNHEKIAAYRDGEDTLHQVSPKCTHMGCMVEWNNAEETWDCPCHGSQFTCKGEVNRGPAIHPLPHKVTGEISRNTVENKTTGLEEGHGKVISVEENQYAVYKDMQGEYLVMSAFCTHLGCKVGWNSEDKTWDCPCHGSRFNHDGTVKHGPAAKRLKKVKII